VHVARDDQQQDVEAAASRGRAGRWAGDQPPAQAVAFLRRVASSWMWTIAESGWPAACSDTKARRKRWRRFRATAGGGAQPPKTSADLFGQAIGGLQVVELQERQQSRSSGRAFAAKQASPCLNTCRNLAS
jgi:hypothetical protein